ncbi:MAG: hypothetical protein HOK80_01700, partial [Candidatus Cloacimonetes bacterium]|nr:hypothetical protein [Candidatus Cloacimonadota bacterium]
AIEAKRVAEKAAEIVTPIVADVASMSDIQIGEYLLYKLEKELPTLSTAEIEALLPVLSAMLTKAQDKIIVGDVLGILSSIVEGKDFSRVELAPVSGDALTQLLEPLLNKLKERDELNIRSSGFVLLNNIVSRDDVDETVLQTELQFFAQVVDEVNKAYFGDDDWGYVNDLLSSIASMTYDLADNENVGVALLQPMDTALAAVNVGDGVTTLEVGRALSKISERMTATGTEDKIAAPVSAPIGPVLAVETETVDEPAVAELTESTINSMTDKEIIEHVMHLSARLVDEGADVNLEAKNFALVLNRATSVEAIGEVIGGVNSILYLSDLNEESLNGLVTSLEKVREKTDDVKVRSRIDGTLQTIREDLGKSQVTTPSRKPGDVLPLPLTSLQKAVRVVVGVGAAVLAPVGIPLIIAAIPVAMVGLPYALEYAPFLTRRLVSKIPIVSNIVGRFTTLNTDQYIHQSVNGFGSRTSEAIRTKDLASLEQQMRTLNDYIYRVQDDKLRERIAGALVYTAGSIKSYFGTGGKPGTIDEEILKLTFSRLTNALGQTNDPKYIGGIANSMETIYGYNPGIYTGQTLARATIGLFQARERIDDVHVRVTLDRVFKTLKGRVPVRDVDESALFDESADDDGTSSDTLTHEENTLLTMRTYGFEPGQDVLAMSSEDTIVTFRLIGVDPSQEHSVFVNWGGYKISISLDSLIDARRINTLRKLEAVGFAVNDRVWAYHPSTGELSNNWRIYGADHAGDNFI